MAKGQNFELAVKIAAKIDPSFSGNLNKAGKEVESLGSRVATATSKMAKVAFAATAALTGATAAFVTASVKSAAEYEAQLSNVSTLLGGTAAEVQARKATISDEILDISNRTGESTAGLADGMYQVISAFGDTADSAKILEIATKGAIAGNATTVDSINMLSAVTKSYGDTSIEAMQKASDLAFQTVVLGQTSFPELASGLQTAATSARALNLSQEELYAGFATLTGVTGDTANVATQLKGLYSELMKPTSSLAGLITQAGYASAYDMVQTEGLGGTLNYLMNAVDGNTVAFRNLWGNSRAAQAAMALAGAQSDVYSTKLEALNNVSGATDLAFERQTSNLNDIVKKIKNLGANFMTSVGTRILPYVEKFAQQALPKIADAMDVALAKLDEFAPHLDTFFSFLTDHGGEAIAIAGGIATALGALSIGKLGGFLDIGGAVQRAIGNMDNLKKEGSTPLLDFKKLFNIQTAKTNLANIVLSFGNAGTRIKDFGKSIGSYFGGLQGGVAKLRLGDAFNGIGDALKDTKLGGIFSSLTGKASGIFGGLKTALSSGIAQALSGIKSSSIVTSMTQLFSGASGKITGAIAKVLQTPLAGGLGKVFSGIATRLPALGGLISTALGPLGSMFGSILAGGLPIIGVISAIIAVFSIFGDHIEDIRGLIQKVFGDGGVAVFDGILGAVQGVGDKIKGIFSPQNLATARNAIQNMFGDGAANAFDGIVSIANSVMGIVQQLVTFSETYVKPIITSLWQLITQTILPGILNAFSAAAPYISSIVSGIGSAVIGVATMIAQGIQAVWPIVEFVVSAIMGAIQVAVPTILAYFSSLWQSLSSIVSSIQTVFSGLIDFITGIFTGNWQQAWEGVKQIFSGAFSALVELCKMPINGVISIINAAISGINGLGLEIPDWVPLIGGKSFSINIPTIPTLAAGGIATRATLAEIGEGGEKEAVLPLSKLNSLLQATSERQAQTTAATALGDMQTGIRAPALAFADGGSAAASMQTDTWNGGNISYSPNIVIQGNASESDVQGALRSGFDEFKRFMAQYEKEHRRFSFAQ